MQIPQRQFHWVNDQINQDQSQQQPFCQGSSCIRIAESVGLSFSLQVWTSCGRNLHQQLQEGSWTDLSQEVPGDCHRQKATVSPNHPQNFNSLTMCMKRLSFIVLLVRGESESYLKRQSGVFEGTSKKDLTSIQNDEQYKAVHKHVPRYPALP